MLAQGLASVVRGEKSGGNEHFSKNHPDFSNREKAKHLWSHCRAVFRRFELMQGKFL